jgi:hypothetical protein
VPLSAPNRILDTRSSAGRASILDASGNLNSSGMLIGGKTIHVNLTSLVNFANAVTAKARPASEVLTLAVHGQKESPS